MRHPGTIVLVEDHPELATYLGERLRDHAPVEIFSDAEPALKYLHEQGCRVLISDIRLPGMSGIELCRQIRLDTDLSDTPVIMISALSSDASRQAALAAGATAFLVKPFGLNDLLEAIAAACPSTNSNSAYHPAMQYALEHLGQAEFGVTQWADKADLSIESLTRTLFQTTGLTPSVWLREQRLLQVHDLLGSGVCKTLSEAGALSGLDNPAYLKRLYRNRFGDD